MLLEHACVQREESGEAKVRSPSDAPRLPFQSDSSFTYHPLLSEQIKGSIPLSSGKMGSIRKLTLNEGKWRQFAL